MTTLLYRPVLIETAEQAEALPEGTIATDPGTYAAEKGGGLWFGDGGPWPSSLMVGWSALVPIEAEEETRSVARHSGGGQTNYNTEAAGNPGRMGEYIASLPIESRYVTPWEEQS